MKREVSFCDAPGCKNFDISVCPLCQRDYCAAHGKTVAMELRIGTVQIAPWAGVCEMCTTQLSHHVNSLNYDERKRDPVYRAHYEILTIALHKILPLLSSQIAALMIEQS